ncbi:MAG: cation:proton antiporter [Oscillospiraceae bacterium]|nr:cation:proton antiporter [Oscillospiraceae bacterium]
MIALLNVAFALMAGLMMTRLFNKWHLPDVTAFLVAGVLIGPFVLGRIGIAGLGFPTYDDVAELSILSNVAMGFIAFSIGDEFRLDSLQKTGKKALVIGVVQALVACLAVDAALLLFHLARPDLISAPAAITLGAIATATAPAATLMVVRQYKAKGELTSLLLPIVALDDAVGLIVFAVSFGIARAMTSGSLSLLSVLVEPLLEIVLSLLLGAVAGYVLTELERLFHSNTNRTSMTIAFVFLTVGLSSLKFTLGGVHLGFSSLLVCMMLGTVFCNLSPLSDDLMGRADRWSQPLLAVFFVISGAELQLEVFSQPMLVLIGVVYILFRSLGKYFGAAFSSRFMGASPNVVKYLGVTLLPQAGVALGMCVTARQLGETDGMLVRNIILFSVLVYELVGPLMTKEALLAAGEIGEKPQEVLTRRERALAAATPKKLAMRHEAKRKERHGK